MVQMPFVALKDSVHMSKIYLTTLKQLKQQFKSKGKKWVSIWGRGVNE